MGKWPTYTHTRTLRHTHNHTVAYLNRDMSQMIALLTRRMFDTIKMRH